MKKRADRDVHPKGQFPCWLSALINQGKAIGGFIMKKELTQARLKELLHYDPITGVFTRLKTVNYNAQKGDVAGWNSGGYKQISIDGKKYKTSRLAWLYMEGYWPEHIVDHEDRIKNNDKWKNLRHISQQCNLRNCNIKNTNKSGATGISIFKRDQRWRASITINGKHIHLGLFVNKIDAIKARWKAELKYSFPNCNTTSSAYQYLKKEGAV